MKLDIRMKYKKNVFVFVWLYVTARGLIAQSVERSANNAVALGSSPSMTIYCF